MAGTSATRPAGWPLIANLALAAWLLADAVRVAIFASISCTAWWWPIFLPKASRSVA